jgi:transcriptional regulator with XRE-family HTH domain
MTISNPLQGHPDGAALRKQAGLYVKQLREAAGLTQQQTAKQLGLDYYTLISQVERGITRVPPDKIRAWAHTLGADPKKFAARLLSYYDPYMWEILFSGLAQPVEPGSA